MRENTDQNNSEYGLFSYSGEVENLRHGNVRMGELGEVYLLWGEGGITDSTHYITWIGKM